MKERKELDKLAEEGEEAAGGAEREKANSKGSKKEGQEEREGEGLGAV